MYPARLAAVGGRSYPLAGPGSPASTNCSAAPCTTHYRLPPDHRPTGPDRTTISGKAGQTDSSTMPATAADNPGRSTACHTEDQRWIRAEARRQSHPAPPVERRCPRIQGRRLLSGARASPEASRPSCAWSYHAVGHVQARRPGQPPRIGPPSARCGAATAAYAEAGHHGRCLAGSRVESPAHQVRRIRYCTSSTALASLSAVPTVDDEPRTASPRGRRRLIQCTAGAIRRSCGASSPARRPPSEAEARPPRLHVGHR